MSIVKPVAPEWHPNPVVQTISHEGLNLGNKVEIIDIESRKRSVIYESNDNFTSPYFSKSGNTVLFDKAGKTFGVAINEGGITDVSASKKEQIKEPNEKYIYYSEGEKSTNQIWRKNKNGSKAEQLTFDLDHNRFPHVSPDGKWIAYISFPHDSNPKESVDFQRVSLKLLPTAGGGAKTLAYFYGGKGSFKNYAWSPDSKSLVFVNQADIP